MTNPLTPLDAHLKGVQVTGVNDGAAIVTCEGKEYSFAHIADIKALAKYLNASVDDTMSAVRGLLHEYQHDKKRRPRFKPMNLDDLRRGVKPGDIES